MIRDQISAILESVRSWPAEDQAELADYARQIQARRTRLYVMTEEERAAVEEGKAQIGRGEFASGEDVAALWKRIGA